jgi:type VI secretion system secreted protein Hcp
MVEARGRAMAAVDYFLKFDGIKGESTDAKHKDEIDIESWSWGETRPGRGAGSGRVAMQDFQFVMKVNKATPALMKACATGQHITSARMTGRKAGKDQQEFLTFTFSDVRVSSYQTTGIGVGDVQPGDQVALNFVKIEVEYRPQRPDGSLGASERFGYDLKTHKAF